MSASDAAERIAGRLKLALGAEAAQVEDDSGLHTGHKGAGGGGHFSATVVARKFEGMSRIERHRAVYAALEGLDVPIHALAIRALTPGEAGAGR